MPKSWEYRFRDPAFAAIWQRWQNARNAWHRDWWFTTIGELKDIYNPDPTVITKPIPRAAAQEFIDARTAYLAELATYSKETA